VTQEVVLNVLKFMAGRELSERHGLRHRIPLPVTYQYLGSTH